ncbi:hypothetical protein [Chengkuizengella sediminis]|uniref:hypothetical protein n=1 Tax=Chengkuizengella sediminis TaxID=1885917 RepID=UPI001389E585|nr:hypothetical protein [Chengkuizengella sediminis]NDI35719.1 hypothetical protein [Chengkuizengella sediminis]
MKRILKVLFIASVIFNFSSFNSYELINYGYELKGDGPNGHVCCGSGGGGPDSPRYDGYLL